MMKTRHKRKTQEGTSQHEENLTIFMPDDIDLATLSNLLPDTSITSPSPDAIVALYRLLLAQSSELENAHQELENAQAEAEKKDVELDQALQDRETGLKEMETQVEVAQEGMKKLKTERDELGM
jgi:nucleoprotein TPR